MYSKPSSTSPRWKQIACTGDLPAGRIGHTLCANAAEDTVYLYGGVNDTSDHASQYLEDLYAFHYITKAWRRIEMSGELQFPRAFHTAVWHEEKMYIFGGCNGRGRFNKLFSIAPDGRVELQHPLTPVPLTRYCHSAALFCGRMYVFAGKCGGRNSNKRLSDLYCFDFSANGWLECLQLGDVPPSRSAHAAFTCGRNMVMFGGRSSVGECCEDLYQYQYDSCIWTRIETHHGPLFGRARHSVVVHHGRVVVFGGWNGKKKLNDLFYYHMDSETFEVAHDQDESCPSRRECHVAVTCKNAMVVFGGRFRGFFMNDTCELELGGKSLKGACCDWLLEHGIDLDHSVPPRLRDYPAAWRRLNGIPARGAPVAARPRPNPMLPPPPPMPPLPNAN